MVQTERLTFGGTLDRARSYCTTEDGEAFANSGAAPVKLSLCHREELAVQLGELSFSLSLRLR